MKTRIIIIVGVVCFIGFYLLFSTILPTDTQEQSDLDVRFAAVTDELQQYGGAMIVSYDTETGEITGKRPAYTSKEAGVLSVSQEEYNRIGSLIPKGSLIAPEGLTPAEAIEYVSSN